jgi:endonuclease-3
MATPSRAALIGRTIKVLKKHYKPVAPLKDRTLLEHLLLACLLEDSPHDAAEQVFATLKQNYFDWNEVRVSTIRELSEALRPLVNPAEAAARLKQTLHSVFESVYQFDIETLKKQNIGQAVKQLEKYNGTTPFVVAYVTQMALGGHSIPLNRGALVSFHTVGVISDDEFAKGSVPGLERVVSKNKGVEIGSLIHQLGVEVGRNPLGQTARKLLLEIDPRCKDRLPKRHLPQPIEEVPPPAKPHTARPSTSKVPDPKLKKAPEVKLTKPAAAPKKKVEQPTKKPVPRPAKATKKPTKHGKKHSTKHGAKRTTARQLTKRKPR